MDQTMPNFSLSFDGSTYSNGYNDYFPQFAEHDYDIPVPAFPPNEMAYLHNGHCLLPDSPPDSHPDHYAIPNQFTMPGVNRQHTGFHPDVSSSTGPSTSGVIPIPTKAPVNMIHPGLPNIPPFPYAKKRLKNLEVSSTSYSSASNSPLSIHSCKQEDDRDLDFPMSNCNTGNLYYQPGVAGSDDVMYNGSSDDGHRNIVFKPIFLEQWCNTVHNDRVPASIIEFKVQADKGFNFSQYDGSFICQKKNHFQVTAEVVVDNLPQYVKLPTGHEYETIKGFFVDLFGVRAESIHQNPIKIEESQSDRSRKPFIPRNMDLSQLRQQMTIARLHFSETTANNMRKKFKKPNPDQRYFRLVLGLYAVVEKDGQQEKRLLTAAASENIIVRASNPQQFDNDGIALPVWQKVPHEEDAIFHVGNIGINNDHPEDALDIRGNIRLSGRLIQPSDARAKDILEEMDPKKQLESIRSLKMYRYKYKDEVARALNLTDGSVYDTGILAQEVLETIPEAVEMVGDLELENGDTLENFLMVNKDRLFMENLGAVKELYNLTDSFGSRIVELERVHRKLAHLRSRDSFRSNVSALSAKSIPSSLLSSASHPLPTSVSQRPSVYSIVPPPGYSSQKSKKPDPAEPARVAPSVRLGKTYIQWLTLGLVTLVSICLIALLAMYVTSRSSSVTSDDQMYASTSLVSLTTGAALFSTISTNAPIIVPNSSEPGYPQVIVDVNWDDVTIFWSTGLCKFVTPVANDQQCVLNETYAKQYCTPSPFMENEECCVKISAEQFIPPHLISINGHGYGYGRQTPQKKLPEYQTDQINDNPRTKTASQNLRISFVTEEDKTAQGLPGIGDLTKHYPSKLFGRNIDNGNAVLYRSDIAPKAQYPPDITGANTDISKKEDRYVSSTEPCPDNAVYQTENWDMVEHIDLVEPNIRLNRAYCNTRKESCGTNRNFLLTIPLSKYYAEQNITVRFTLKPDTIVTTCAHYIEGGNCYRNHNRSGFVCRSDEYEERITVPIGNYLRSELKIRVADKRTVMHFNKSICDIDNSKDIVYYNIVFIRSCR